MIKIKRFVTADMRREVHAIITVSDPTLSFHRQLEEVMDDYASLVRDAGGVMKPVFRRWFVSDSANQSAHLPHDGACATSVVEQAPLSLTKLALWVWMIEGAEVKQLVDGVFVVSCGGCTHLFEGSRCRPGLDSEAATYEMLSSTDSILHRHGGTLLDNCVRTWFFVQNVDVNYAGVVAGRNRSFREKGLAPHTRFIASTGIGGRNADSTVAVQMDSYSVLGLEPGQMRQVNAPDYLNPTHEYGVAFERATSVDYSDRRHLFISGTASIDNKGEVVWEGDIRRQTLRMWTNVEALLKAAECEWKDVGHMLVYLRDPADYCVVKEMFAERSPDIPYVILLAPVCRPGWLIEMECMAMKPIKTSCPSF